MGRPRFKVRGGSMVAVVAAAVGLAAVLIRLPYLGWGLPDIDEEALPLKKAFEMWGWRDGRFSLDPETAGWPSLSFYVHLLLQHLIYWFGRLGGAFNDRLDFYLLQRDFTPLVLAGRTLGVAAAGVVALLAVRLGERMVRPFAGGRWGLFAGALAGAALAVSPLLYVESRLITPDILLTLLAALAVVRMVDIYDNGRLRDYVWAAVFIGLGASAKYSPVLLVPVLYLAHLLRRRNETAAHAARSLSSRLGLLDRRLLWAALACALAFCLTSPYLILDLAVFKRDFHAQITHLGGGHFGHEERSGLSFYYLREVLTPAFGWPGLLLAMSGLFWAAWRLRGAWLVVAASAVCLYMGLGFLSTQFERYMLPLLMPLSIGLAAAVAWLATWPVLRKRALATTAASLMAGATLVFPALTTAGLARSQALPSTQHLAREFIQEALAQPHVVFAMEHYSPALPVDRRLWFNRQDAFARLSAEQRDMLLGGRVFDVFYIPFYSINAELAAFYYDLRHYLPADIILTSSAVRGRFEQMAERFPRQMTFYRDLERYTQLLRVFRPGDRARGPEIHLYRFTPESRERLIRDRGMLEPGFYEPYLATLHAPHFHAFLADVAWHAYNKQMFWLADLYYQALDETIASGAERVLRGPHVLARLQLGQVDKARRMCEDELRRDPHNLQAMALLGLVFETQGELELALEAYRRCIAAGEAAAAAGFEPDLGAYFDGPRWAREQLESLHSRLKE